jgi:hypothetical protein
MFIDKAMNSTGGAPAERNVSGQGCMRATYVSLRWSEKKSMAVMRSINISPRNGAKARMFKSTFILRSRTLITSSDFTLHFFHVQLFLYVADAQFSFASS